MTDQKRNILLLVLSLAAGCVDAIAFLNTGTFPANMTGNSVMLGLAVVHVSVDGATLSFLALLGFAAGVVAGALFMPSIQGDRRWTRDINTVLLAAGLLLSATVLALKYIDPVFHPWMIVPSAIAMGMQSAAVLRLGVAGVSTTVITGTLTTALVRLTGRFRKGRDPGREDKPWLPMLSWGAYFLGALIGGVQNVWHENWILAVPGLLLVGVALSAGQGRSSRW